MEKDDLLDLELKIDELKRDLENIHSELSDIKNKIPDINKLENLHERTNKILDRIEIVITVFGWVFVGFGVIRWVFGF